MEEYISKEEIINECRQYANHEHNVKFKPDVSKDRKHDSEVAMFMCEHFRKFVKELPSADVRENIHGHWGRRIVDNGFNADWVCSECGHREYTDFIHMNFCPDCGADMREPIGEKGK